MFITQCSLSCLLTLFFLASFSSVCVGISHHVICHVTDHRTHIAAAIAPSFLESTLLQSTDYDPYCALLSLLRVVCIYFTTYATAGSFALSITLFLYVEKCQKVSKLTEFTEIAEIFAKRKIFLYFYHFIIQNLNHIILTAIIIVRIE